MFAYTVLPILLLAHFHLLLVRSQTVSIDDSQAFDLLRSCARNPFVNNGYSVGSHLSCEYPADNSCFCRADLQQNAISYVSSQVVSRCNSNSLDVSSAVGLYTSYCANINVEATPATTTDTSVTPTSPSPSSTEPTPSSRITSFRSSFVTASPTLASSSASTATNESVASDPSGASSGIADLGTGEIVGIVVGIVALAVAVITLIINWKTLKTHLKQRYDARPGMAANNEPPMRQYM